MRFNTLKRMSNYVDQFRVGQISGYSLSRVWVKQCLCVCAPLAYRDFANRALVKRFIPFPAACEDAVIAKEIRLLRLCDKNLRMRAENIAQAGGSAFHCADHQKIWFHAISVSHCAKAERVDCARTFAPPFRLVASAQLIAKNRIPMASVEKIESAQRLFQPFGIQKFGKRNGIRWGTYFSGAQNSGSKMQADGARDMRVLCSSCREFE